MEIQLYIKTYKQEGDLAHEYNPLRNRVNSDGEIGEFNTDEISVDLNNPLNIECQPSYDGTVNLIINDDKNPPRIINTRFSKIEDNRYRIINRNQIEQTNLYKEGKIDQQTRLFRNINKIPKIDLSRVYNMGQLMGGNYTFYIKFADNDFNKTDVVAESSQVSVFKGQLAKINSISGTMLDERTDKSVTLKISNVDTSFSKIYLYFTRETCDVNGIRQTDAGMFTKPYEIKGETETITINGFEEITKLTPEEINIQYNLVTAVKTQTQVQNMLFFGNVQGLHLNIKDLQNISYYIPVELCQDESIGWVNSEDYSTPTTNDIEQTEYYSPYNIYYRLGYWPDEMYHLGIVYIMNDDSLSPVFNLRGCRFTATKQDYEQRPEEEQKYRNFTVPEGGSYDKLYSLYDEEGNMNYLERDDFIPTGEYLDNTFGVFKNPKAVIINYEDSTVRPLYYKIEMPADVRRALADNKVKGYFIVRQKRIATTLCQGLSVGVDRISHIPMLHEQGTYFTESFIDKNQKLTTDYNSRIIRTERTPTLQSLFDGSEFILEPQVPLDSLVTRRDLKSRYYYHDPNKEESAKLSNLTSKYVTSGVNFVGSDTPLKYVNSYGFSTKCGTQEDVSQFAFFAKRDFSSKNNRLVRGQYCPFLGTRVALQKNTIYSVKVPNYSRALLRDYFSIRGRSNAEFFAISDRHELNELDELNVYRGDCYSNTVTIRLNRNFIDSEVPINETIMDPDCWSENYKGYGNMINGEEKESSKKGSWINVNRADVNTVPLGIWVTYKCLSSHNLGIRSEDKRNTEEIALMGSPRTFYPVSDISVDVSHKIEESFFLNDGFNATVGKKRNYIAPDVPYVKDLYDNRIMFSNVQREDDFKNAYRIFQGLSFQDIDRQYGAIVKFIPLGVNIFCVFEHGVGIIPINEKALIQTTTGQAIHMYGAGVLQNQISLVNSDFGSIWPESIIKTHKGIYGVDTYAKKIWRYTENGGFNCISDMRVQHFLNENIKLREEDKYPIFSLKNVKTHFNNYKGDIIFTFYNDDENSTWSLCYNERMDKWITRYSWTPLYSENINNIFYTLDQERAKLLGYIFNNRNCEYGIRTSNNQYIVNSTSDRFSSDLSLVGHTIVDGFDGNIKSIETGILVPINFTIPTSNSYKVLWEKDATEDYKEVKVLITDENVISTLFNINSENTLQSETYAALKTFFNSTFNADVPLYFILHCGFNLHLGSTSSEILETIGIVSLVKSNVIDNEAWAIRNTTARKIFLRNGFYVHGRAGIFNEMDYEDKYFDNQILPTKWFERQEPFEFEFVVKDPVGAHKIFDNLAIISNNVQPNEIEYEIIGDIYDFNKTGIFRHKQFNEDVWDTKYNKPKFLGNLTQPRLHFGEHTYQSTQEFYNCDIKWDNVLNEYTLVTKQPCKNIYTYGRRLGNIQYKEDTWYITIDPIKYKESYRIDGQEVPAEGTFADKTKEVRIRDKFVKIRVKYTGQDLVIITALQTIYTQSYA